MPATRHAHCQELMSPLIDKMLHCRERVLRVEARCGCARVSCVLVCPVCLCVLCARVSCCQAKVRVLVAKPDDLSAAPKTHMVERTDSHGHPPVQRLQC